MIQYKNQQEKILNYKIMERMDAQYDVKEKMITSYRGAHGYHSTLVNQWVHPTRDSLAYAYELMNRGEADDFEEAQSILKRVVPLQDTNPENTTYGIWSYYMEEPLSQMMPPDWNWADFCGKVLIQILMDYGNRLKDNLPELIHTAIIHCCNSIMRRDMGPHYTNISIMGTLVVMAAGEVFKLESLLTYSRKRLAALHEFNIGHGAFQEYNSPSYTWVVIDDLAAMMPYITDVECLQKFRDINHLAWKCIADHYHFKTKQWAGPHSRFYAMLEDAELQMRIQRALDYHIMLISLDDETLAEKLPMGFFSSQSICPDCYKHYFTETTESRSTDAVFAYGNSPADREIAVCRQTADYNLGSFYKSTFWNQRRNHISYFGTEESPVYCCMKCLHDYYDYSSAMIVTAQDEMRTVSVVAFATDGGDTHCNLDLIQNASIMASDLRIRFEIGGAVENVIVSEAAKGTFIAETEEEKIKIKFPYGEFGGYPVTYDITEEKNHVNETGDHKHAGSVIGIDAVFYHGEPKIIHFTELETCCCGITFEIISNKDRFTESPKAEIHDGLLWVECGNLKAAAPSAAVSQIEFREKAQAYRDNKEYLQIY